MKNLTDIRNSIYKKQKLLLGISIFTAFLAVSFTLGGSNDHWIWTRIPFVALILISVSIGLVLLWIKIERYKFKSKINKAKQNQHINERLGLLSKRQREVFHLIAEGKSNKEIANLLFIEPSTLKTHINKIYKTLHIRNRREALNYFLEYKSAN